MRILKTMLGRAYGLSSYWSYFSEECDPQPTPAQKENSTVRIVLPFKDDDSTDLVRKQLTDLSLNTHIVIQPVFFCDKIQRELKVHEIKPPIVNQKRAMDKFQYDLCDASYVGCTLRQLHQRVAEYSNSLLPLANTSLTNTVLF